jgi:RND superfamily putative drug exporter
MRRVFATAGRTVFFSSLTVAAALASLLVFPQRFLYSMGLGGALVALFAALISLTVLPAVLTLLGSRVNAGAPKFLQRRAAADTEVDENGFWYRLSRFVMRRPLPVATLSALLLIVMGLPFFGIKFNTVDPTVLPKSASARQAYDTVSNRFPPFHETPIWIDVDGGGPKAAAAMAARVKHVSGVAEVLPPERLRGGVTALQVVSANPFVSDASQETVKGIRALQPPPGATVLVGGASADFIDFQSSLSSHLPIALAIVIVATLVILFLMTGSVILPIKSLLMNFLNLSAVFGLLVLIFQDGRKGSSTTPARGRSSRRCRSCSSPSPSASPPTTRSSCSRGSRRRAITAPRIRSAWRSAWSEPGGSSPPRRCCSRSRWAPSPPRRSSSSRRTGSARRWRY